MTKFASILATTVLSTTFAAGAMASDLQMNVTALDNQATVTLTKNGQAVSNYPVDIQGTTYMTSESGKVVVTNEQPNARFVNIVAKDDNGNVVSEERFLGRKG
ncbi:hypothetical protein SD340_000480 [Vibrio fluvialis]|nr:hypothetical protein [Vibrio fluvialis]ELU8398670.1 hypothetical protein [Vibrio fluvialis]